MPQTVIELGQKVKQKYPGQYDDLSDDELGRRIKSKYPGSYDDYGDVEKPSLKSLIPPAKPVEATYGMRLKEGLKEFGKAVMNPFAGEQVVAGEPPAVDIAAPGLSMASGLKTLLRESPLGRLIPSASRAGETLQSILQKAKGIPVETGPAEAAAREAVAAKATGAGSLSDPLREFIKRTKPVTAKFGGQRVTMIPDPVPYEEAMQFASNTKDVLRQNARIAKAGGDAMRPAMSTATTKFMQGMRGGTRDVAESVQMGDLYDQAMNEYRRAMALSDAAKTAKRFAVKRLLPGGVATGIGYEIWRRR